MDSGIKKFFCGPESFTPDLAPIVGESPELKNYFVAAGLNSIGILSAGGLGRILAHWILKGSPDVDVTGFKRGPLSCLPVQPGLSARQGRGVTGHGLQVSLTRPRLQKRLATFAAQPSMIA